MEGLRTATPIVAPPTGIIPNADVSAIYYVVNKNYRDPYVMSYNLTVQQELGRNFVLDAAYVGNQGRQIPAGYNLNADRSAPGAGAQGQPLYGITGGGQQQHSSRGRDKPARHRHQLQLQLSTGSRDSARNS